MEKREFPCDFLRLDLRLQLRRTKPSSFGGKGTAARLRFAGFV